jgi:hypothetical protein
MTDNPADCCDRCAAQELCLRLIKRCVWIKKESCEGCGPCPHHAYPHPEFRDGVEILFKLKDQTIYIDGDKPLNIE